jgi:hypothetical protein
MVPGGEADGMCFRGWPEDRRRMLRRLNPKKREPIRLALFFARMPALRYHVDAPESS